MKVPHIKPRWIVLLLVVAMVAFLVLRRVNNPDSTPGEPLDPETTPTMVTYDAFNYVTDSGYTRYYIEAPVWKIFSEAEKPYQTFGQGIYAEQYDDKMQVVTTLVCDSLIYFNDTRLAQLIGNVHIDKPNGDKFMTPFLYWDQQLHKLYSDSFIHLESQGKVVEGYGFRSDEQITDYVVHNPTMIIPLSALHGTGNPADPAENSEESVVDTPETVTQQEPVQSQQSSQPRQPRRPHTLIDETGQAQTLQKPTR